MTAAELLQQLQATFPSGQTTGTFDAAQVLEGEYGPLLSGMGIPTTLDLTSANGWQSEGTDVTLSGSASTAILGVAGAEVFFQLTPSGDDWVLLLDVALPAGWTLGQSFPLLAQGLFDELQLDPSLPAALVIASAAASDPQRTVEGQPLAVGGGLTFFGRFSPASPAFAPVAWLLGAGPLPLSTGAITYVASSGAVTTQLPLGTATLGTLFGASGPSLDFTVSLYSGLNEALQQYESGVRFEATLAFGSAGDVALGALLTGSQQPVLDLFIAGTALAFPTPATLAQFLGEGNTVADALPAQFANTSLLQVNALTFGIGLQSTRLEYVFLSVGVAGGQTWALLPGVIELGEVSFLFSVFDPLGSAPTEAFTFRAVLTLGGVPIIIQAELPGEVLSGGLDPTADPPSLVPLLQEVLGFTSGLPDELVIASMEFGADVSQSFFSAELEIEGDWSFDFGIENQLVFEDLTLSFAWSADEGAAASVSATLALNADNRFQVEADLVDGSPVLKGSWTDTGAPLTFQDIAIGLGMYGLPNLPDGLDLGLTRADFTFDAGAPSFTFDLETVLYTGGDPDAGHSASAALVAGKDAAGSWGYVYGMVVGLDLAVDLTQIPLVGTLVPAGFDAIAIHDLRIVAATTTLPVFTLTDELATILGTVVNSGLVLAIDLQVGNDLSETFSVRFGGSDDGTAADVPPSGSGTGTGTGVAAPGPAGGAAPGPQATWIDVQRAFGPVQINRVGFSLTPDSRLALLLDAAVSLGGLGIGLTGLEADFPLQAPFLPRFSLAGLQVQLSGGAFSIGGGLLKTPGADPPEYSGDLTFSMGTFGATAYASYTTVNGDPSLFAFLFVNAALGGPAFCFVTGLAGGFGYNRALRLPAAAEVPQFPLVQGAMGALTSGQTLAALDTYITPRQGAMWLAAGVRFTSFQMVQSFALLTVSFGTSVEIALLGQSTLVVPAGETAHPVAVANLGIVADLQPASGVLAVSAQLAPGSYVLDPSAQLTGGFAFYLWFAPSPYAGDFVVTLGGYHPYFAVPDHYPRVPRLGLNWQVTPELTVKGAEYYALTPQVMMAGGTLSATWQSGGIRAWFDAQADFLVRFKPFAYAADVSVSIGVSLTLDLLVTSITLTLQVGVALSLWGPPFGGVATVDLAIVSFTLSFGWSGHPDAAKLDWPTFRASFLPPAQPGVANSPILSIGAPAGILGTVDEPDAPPAWSVSPGALRLAVGTQVPATALALPDGVAQAPGTAWTTALGVGPMDAGIGTLTSTLALSFTREGASSAGGAWTATPVLGSVPTALWASTSSSMQEPATVAGALVGLTLLPTPPGGQSTLEVPLPALLAGAAPVVSWSWSTTAAPQGDPFDQGAAMAELQATLADPAVATTRSGILAALRGQGLATADSVRVDAFARNAANLLFAAPALRYLGEVPSTTGN